MYMMREERDYIYILYIFFAINVGLHVVLTYMQFSGRVKAKDKQTNTVVVRISSLNEF